MMMVEELVCGTPVIAFPESAASEIVINGENGMLVDDEVAMATAIRRLDTIDPTACRASVAERYSVPATAARYVRVYRQAITRAQPRKRDWLLDVTDLPVVGLFRARSVRSSLRENANRRRALGEAGLDSLAACTSFRCRGISIRLASARSGGFRMNRGPARLDTGRCSMA